MGKPSLSPSKISTYLACPVRYRWTYADPRGRPYLRAKGMYSFGTTLHRVLEKFHGGGETGVATIGQVAAAYDESWIDAGFSDAAEMAEAYGEGLQILERYVEEQAREPATSQTLFVERVLKGEYEHFRLIGRLDRVDERADGVLEIVDYKSGRTEVSSDDVVADLAMGCYQLLLSKLHPGRPMVATIVALRSGARASCGFSPEELAEFERDLVKLGDQIVTDEIFDRLPSWKPLCAQCDFLTLCRRHPDFDEPPSEVARGENW